MKKILMISKFWKEYNRSGMGFCSSKHYEILLGLGYEVSRVSTESICGSEVSLAPPTFHVCVKGSGALYSPVSIDIQRLANIIKRVNPDILVVEAWQTGISEKAIELAHALEIPVVMISHGISIFPFDFSFKSLLRSILWVPYALITLPRIIRKLSAITTLNKEGRTFRLIDREIAKLFNKELYHLTNFPVNHYVGKLKPFSTRRKQILCVGYYSYVKNQIKALEILKLMPTSFVMIFVGEKNGGYYKKVINFVKENKLNDRVEFYEDTEINLSNLYGSSLFCLSTSITEVLPLFLLESMASGVPFVGTNVGVNDQLGGGFISNSNKKIVDFILALSDDELLWNKYSNICLEDIHKNYSEEIVTCQLKKIIESAL
jgi:glycosyltransferase involved in cell wall biosynthesis